MTPLSRLRWLAAVLPHDHHYHDIFDITFSPTYSVRPAGAQHQWRKVPPRELSVELVADERLGRATDWVEAS